MAGLLPWAVEKDGNLEICDETVRSLKSQVRMDEKLVILSIVGKFRQGKTFFMNVLLKALKKNGKARFEPGDTIGGAENFSFQNGDEGHTTGIMAYSEVLRLTPKNEKLAVILLDTQGTADPGKSKKIKDSILAITSLMSSITIFNIQNRFEEDSLHALTLMVEHSQKISEQADSRLMVLIRDSAKGKCRLGHGLDNLKELVKNSGGKTDSIDRIEESFHTIDTFNVPRPKHAVYNANGSIAVEECGDEFLDALLEVANYIVCDGLQPRKGINRKDFPDVLQDLANKLRNNQMISNEDVCETARRVAKSDVYESLRQWIEQNTGKGIEPAHFNAELEDNNKQILEAFRKDLYGGKNSRLAYYEAFVGEFQVRCDEEKQRYEQCFIKEQRQKAEEERLRQKAAHQQRQLQENEEMLRQVQAEKALRIAKDEAYENLRQWINQNTGKGMEPAHFTAELRNNNEQIFEAFRKALCGSENAKKTYFVAFVEEFQFRCDEENQRYEQYFNKEQRQKAEQERLRRAADLLEMARILAGVAHCAFHH